MILILLAGLLAAIVAAETATLAFPFVTRVALAIRALGYPGGRRSQKEAIPRLGGVALTVGIAAGAILPSLAVRKYTSNRSHYGLNDKAYQPP